MKIQVISFIRKTMVSFGMLALAATVSACAVEQSDGGETEATAEAQEQMLFFTCSEASQHPVCMSECGEYLYICQQSCVEQGGVNVWRCLMWCDDDYNECLNYCDNQCNGL